jgi:hypothetical protein
VHLAFVHILRIKMKRWAIAALMLLAVVAGEVLLQLLADCTILVRPDPSHPCSACHVAGAHAHPTRQLQSGTQSQVLQELDKLAAGKIKEVTDAISTLKTKKQPTAVQTIVAAPAIVVPQYVVSQPVVVAPVQPPVVAAARPTPSPKPGQGYHRHHW